MKKSTIIVSLVLTSSLSYAFDLSGIAKNVMDNLVKGSETTTTNTSNSTNSNLDNGTVTNGLKEALKVSIDYNDSTKRSSD